jgi:hypothetical protein
MIHESMITSAGSTRALSGLILLVIAVLCTLFVYYRVERASEMIFSTEKLMKNFEQLNLDFNQLSETFFPGWPTVEERRLEEMIVDMHERARSLLKWAAALDPRAAKEVLVWTTLAPAEIHILVKLERALAGYIRLFGSPPGERPAPYARLRNLTLHGHQCSRRQALQQEAVAGTIAMDICSEVEWYKLAQLAWPEARNFMDVGANKVSHALLGVHSYLCMFKYIFSATHYITMFMFTHKTSVLCTSSVLSLFSGVSWQSVPVAVGGWPVRRRFPRHCVHSRTERGTVAHLPQPGRLLPGRLL